MLGDKKQILKPIEEPLKPTVTGGKTGPRQQQPKKELLYTDKREIGMAMGMACEQARKNLTETSLEIFTEEYDKAYERRTTWFYKKNQELVTKARNGEL